MLWLTLVSALAAVAAAVFAAVQAKAATDTLKDAQAAEAAAVVARDEAVRAQQESAANSGRIAAVLEEQAAEARAAASVRRDPWVLGPVVMKNRTKTVLLKFEGDVPAEDVSLEVERQPHFWHIDPRPVASTFHPGDAVKIAYMRAGGDPGTTLVKISWRWADSEEMISTRVTLS